MTPLPPSFTNRTLRQVDGITRKSSRQLRLQRLRRTVLNVIRVSIKRSI